MKTASLYLAFLSLLSACVFCSGIVHAADTYQTEFFVTYSQLKSDGGNKNKSQGIAMIRNFTPVNTKGHPLFEADFLERIGNFQLFLGMRERKIGPGLEGFGPFYGVFINARKPGLPVTMHMEISKQETEFDAPVNAHENSDFIRFGIGAFLINTLHIGLEYSRNDLISTLVNLGVSQKFSFETVRYRIVSKFVLKLDEGKAINIAGNIETARFDSPNSKGKNKAQNISGDYYFTPQLSLGGEFGKLETGKNYATRVRFFMNSSFSVSLGFSNFFADNSENNDSRSLDLFVAARF